MATCATVETPEVMVTDELIPMQEFDRVKNAVCLLRSSTSDPSKSWSGTGFYADVNLKKRDNKDNVHCIITNYHVFCQMKHDDHVVAVFHHESIEKEPFGIPIVPCALLYSSEELDYVLIGIDKSKMQSLGVKPILADINQPPIVKKNDKVFIIQHPKGMMKHFSHDTVKDVKRPFLEYNANTLEGSSGSPVFVVKESKCFLVALHSKGVQSDSSNWNKGVLFSEILNHLLTGKLHFLPTSVPDQMECDVNAIGVSGIEDLFKEWRINRIKDVKIRFAVMGASGVGKSAFINAIRWIDDDDEDAAKTGTFETTTEPIPYIFPDNPNITLVDLPGFGTPCFPDLATYCDKIALETYDIFLLFTTPKLKQSDLELAKIIKSMGKSFFLICTKIDLYVLVKKHRKEPDVEVMFKRIRAGCYKKVKEFEIREDEIFLISNYEKDKWDFSRLIQAILETLPRKKRHHQKEAPNLSLKSLSTDAVSRDTDVSKSVTEEYPVDAGAYNKKNVDHDIEKFLKKKLGGRKDVKIRFGVTGYIDTGKSAFINAIRGLNDDDDGAANVHITETTTKPTEYYHPENPTICFVDLPSIGTPDSPDLPTYCKKVGFESYDKYLVFSSSSSTIYDLELAKKVKSIKKSFFLIRAKIDNDCENEAKKKKFNEKELLEKIKKHCFENVKDYISSENEIFLISNYDREKWDFCRLVEAISDV